MADKEAWLENYQQASFRNIPFFVQRSNSSFGRRAVLTEFPLRDNPEVNDLGRKARSYALEGYLVGADYISQRDDMILAVEKEVTTDDPAQLIHPDYGSIDVICTDLRIGESNSENRTCSLSFTFEVITPKTFPTSVDNTGKKLDDSRKNVYAEIQDVWIDLYILTGKITSKINLASKTIDGFFDQLDTTRRYIANNATYARTLVNLKEIPDQLVRNNDALINSIIDLSSVGTYPSEGDVRADEDNAKIQYEELKALIEFSPEGSPASDDPAQVIADAIQWVSTATAGALIGDIEFDSYEDAVATQNFLLNKIDEISETDIPDSLYIKFRDLRTAIVRDIKVRSTSLARIADVKLPEDEPAIVLSNDLYDSIDGEEDIVKRNFVEHPGFVGSNKVLEVLTNV